MMTSSLSSITRLALAFVLYSSYSNDVFSFQLGSGNSFQRRSEMSMIGSFGIGGGSGKNTQPTLPKDVKDAVSSCRGAVQKALENRMSRMVIEMPVGTKFGIEKEGGKKGGKNKLSQALSDNSSENLSEKLTKERLDTSDRELARLFVDMFQPVGGENIAVVFNNNLLAETAAKKWKGDSTCNCRIKSINRKEKKSIVSRGMGGNKNKKKKAVGFAAKIAAEMGGEDDDSGPFQLPEQCEVALFVAPGPKELVAINRICNDAGMGTLVVLLNARLDKVTNFGTEEAKNLFQKEFEPIFHLAAAPQDVAPGCLLHRSYPDNWIVARKPKVGPPKTIASFPSRPSSEECEGAYGSIVIDDLEKNVENVLDNVANWFQ